MKINILNILCCFILALSSTVAQNPTDACGPAVQALAVNSSNSCIPSAYTLPGSYSNGGANNASCVSGQDRDDGWYQFTAINKAPDSDNMKTSTAPAAVLFRSYLD